MSKTKKESLIRRQFIHPFLKRHRPFISDESLAMWDARIDVQRFPYLSDHQVDGEMLFPAAGHLELAWAVAREQWKNRDFFLENVRFESPLIFKKSLYSPKIRLEISSEEGEFKIFSQSGDDCHDAPWFQHSSGCINSYDRFEKTALSFADIANRFEDKDLIPINPYYETLSGHGLNYGAQFRCIQKLWRRGDELLSFVKLPDDLLHESKRNFFHPALLDACLHALFAHGQYASNQIRIYLPYRLDRMRFYKKPTEQVWSYLRVMRSDEQLLCCNAFIFDETEMLIAEFIGLSSKLRMQAGFDETLVEHEGCYEFNWVNTPRDPHLYHRIVDCSKVFLLAEDVDDAKDLAIRFEKDHIEPRIMKPTDLAQASYDFEGLDKRTLLVYVAKNSIAEISCWNSLYGHPSIASFLGLAQLLIKREISLQKMFLITKGAAGLLRDPPLDLRQASLHGMARVIKSECPNIPITVIDLNDSPSKIERDSLYQELIFIRCDRDDSEIALRGTERFVRQLCPLDRSKELATEIEVSGVGGHYRVDPKRLYLLNESPFRQTFPKDPKEDEVEIAVEAAALNFKDVINSMEILPEEAVVGGLTAERLGLEVVGRVLRCGRNIVHVQEGDAVIARVGEGFRGRVITAGHYVFKKPHELSNAEAAAIPIVFVTAFYSLHYLARITKGETVLIHAAAGGVGGAAIQLAQRAGAHIIATAGKKEKREYLRQLGIEHVFDSRSLTFYDQVMDATKKRGVDIVINSLTRRFLLQSLRCLAPFGRFIEIGKSDIYRSAKLNMQHFGENISYFVVDVDRLAFHKPDFHQKLLNEILKLFENKELKPQNITEFPISKLSDALKFMRRGVYYGKIVASMEHERILALPPKEISFHPNRSYLISGGGLGLEIARFMVERGARYLVLVSCNGCKNDENRAVIEKMRMVGANVLIIEADVSEKKVVSDLMVRIKNEWPELAGVIHAAAVFQDASMAKMDMERFQRVFLVQAQGAFNLSEATRETFTNLDFFLMLSSLSSVLGFFGQLNCSAANFFLDSLALYRRQLGLLSSSINLGLVGQYAGMSKIEKDSADMIKILEDRGIEAMSLHDVLNKLEAVLLEKPVQRVAAKVNWGRFQIAFPHLSRDARFIDLMSNVGIPK